MSMIETNELRFAEAFGNRNDRGIYETQRQIRVTIHQLADSGVVLEKQIDDPEPVFF